MNPKEQLKAIILEQKRKLEKALTIHEQVESRMPGHDRWQAQQESCLHDGLGGLISSDIMLPASILRTAVETMDEYLAALDGFTDQEYRAFMLGLGLQWLHIRYWGKEDLQRYAQKLAQTRSLYEDREASSPAGTMQVQPPIPFLALPELTLLEGVRPSHVVTKAEAVAQAMLQVLGKR